MKRRLCSLFILVSTLFTLPALEYCVRPGSPPGGTGLGWHNALSALPDVLARGAVYYLADGIYGGYRFDDSPIGDAVISIVKATEEDHGPEIGWQMAFGDGVAHFTDTLRFETDYWRFDGRRGEMDADYGFLITTSSCDTDSKLLRIDGGASHIEIFHVEMAHCGENTGNYSQDCLYAVGGSSDITVSHCYLHDVNRVMMLLSGVTDSVFEHNLFSNRYNDTGIHGEAVSINASGLTANVVFRHNVFRNIKGTGFIVVKDSPQGYYYFYGNAFYQTNERYVITNAVITNTGGDYNEHMYVINNTFANLRGIASGIYWSNGSDNYAYNNIWYASVNVKFTNVTHDYNQFYDSGGSHGEAHGSQSRPVFEGLASFDFQLVAPTEAGTSFADSPLEIDPRGRKRGEDGSWDRGAYEWYAYEAEAPRNLRIK